jgi:translation initiation factor IF-2
VTEKTQKTRLYKLAKELNLAHDVLIEFLNKKGIEVKNHMSVLDEDMIELIERHYKKEKVDAERHARKRKEYDEADRRRRGDVKEEKPAAPAAARKEEEGAEPAAVEAEALPVEIEETEEQEVAVVVEETPVVEAPVEEDVEKHKGKGKAKDADAPVEKEPVQEPEPLEAAVEEPAAVEETPAEVVEPETAPAVEAEAEPAEATAEVVEPAPVAAPPSMDVSIAASVPKMGLKVKGKIDLKAATPPTRGKKTKEAAGKAGTGKPGAVATIAESADDKPKHKKKRKKKVTTDKPASTEETPDLEAARRKAALKKPGGKKGKTREVDVEEVQDAIKRTIASMAVVGHSTQRSAMRKRKKVKRDIEQKREAARAEVENRTLRIYEFATVHEIAELMNVSVGDIISSLINLGIMASINQRLDMDTITLVASEYGFEVQPHEEQEVETTEDEQDDDTNLLSRPPIVTIMGHVDHGKTSLLDRIRNTNVVADESGGITQHIGAYTVTMPGGRKIPFLDTPGHEAFTAMRARGAQVTDIVVLVVAADDNVMPQTVEAISHAQAAKVPIVVAINKIDKHEANVERIKQQLADRNVLVEDWGGRHGCVPVSARQGLNIETLLERILLEADMMDLKANPDRLARGVIVESQLDRGKGVTATVLVQKGTLRVGDAFVAGNEFGKIRAMFDERGIRVEEAPPSIPVQVLGFNGLPQAGDAFTIMETDRDARDTAMQRQQIKRESEFRRMRRKTLDDISEQIKAGGVQDLQLIVKADVDGSSEALSDALMRLSTSEVRVNVIHQGVGAISESDVLLASASDAIIIGFRVRPNLNARRLAETEEVDIRQYEIIYNVIDDVRAALEGLLRPDISEKITATVLVRDVFKISRIGTVAGCYVQDGKIARNSRVRLVRDGIVVFTGGIESLKRFKDDVREVDSNFECGISLDGYNDIKEGDVIEAFEQVEVRRSLA